MNDDSDTQTDYYSFLSDKHWIADPIQALFMSRPRKALFRAIMKHSPKSVLDVCCGTGAITNRFTSRGIETTGIDSSKSMLARAEQQERLSHARLMDATRMTFQQEFDAAYINLAIHEMSPAVRDQVWQAMTRAVRPGGVIAVMDLNSPDRDTRLSRFWHNFFELDERNFLRTNPDHYANYSEFISNGGLRHWMMQRTSTLDTERYFFAGNIAVLSAIV